MADYNSELQRYFNTAWQGYLAQNPGADRNAWFTQNAPSLKSYFDVLFQQKATQPPATAPAAAPAAAGGVPYATHMQPSGQDVAELNQAIQNIMASERVDQNTAARILRGEIARPSDGAFTPMAGTGVSPNVKMKPGFDWASLDETIRSNKEAENIQKGTAIGKIDGKNTLQSVQYANEIIANPRNAALNEAIRKGYALGDVPGETVADYLQRSVPGQMAGGHVPGYARGEFYGFDSPEEAMAMAAAREQFKGFLASKYGGQIPADSDQRFANLLSGVSKVLTSGQRIKERLSGGDSTPSDEEVKEFYMLLGGMKSGDRNVQDMRNEILGMDFSMMPGSGDPNIGETDTGLRRTLTAYSPEWYTAAFAPAAQTMAYAPDEAYLHQAERDRWNQRVRENQANRAPTGPVPTQGYGPTGIQSSYIAKPDLTQFPGYAGGGQKTLAGEPHWIVDNQGNPKAAITEDGKKETVKGKGGVEVVPMTEPRKSQYMARKNVPGAMAGRGLGSSAKSSRLAPSRRPGGAAGNSNRNLSGRRTDLPGGGRADVKGGATDGRVRNGKTNNGRPDMPGEPRQRVPDRDAASILPRVASGTDTRGLSDAAVVLRNRLLTRPPMPINVTGVDGQPIEPMNDGIFYTPRPMAEGGVMGVMGAARGYNFAPMRYKANPQQRAFDASGITNRADYDALINQNTMEGRPRRATERVSFGQAYYQNTDESADSFKKRMDVMDKQEAAGKARADQQAKLSKGLGRLKGKKLNFGNIGKTIKNAAPRATTPGAPVPGPVTPGNDVTAPGMRVGEAVLGPGGRRAEERYQLRDFFQGTPDLPVSIPTPIVTPFIGPTPVVTPAEAMPIVGGQTGLMTPAPSLIAGGGPRVLGNNLRSARFGFNRDAPTAIAGRNVQRGSKSIPGVSVMAGWKFNPRTLRNMTTEDRQLLESYISSTGQDPATWYEQAQFAEPRRAAISRSFF